MDQQAHEGYMQMAIDLSEQALDTGKGGPFGAIIVKGRRSPEAPAIVSLGHPGIWIYR
jgi:tRNA(Arg) A34 adenosine deaminase TadA